MPQADTAVLPPRIAAARLWLGLGLLLASAVAFSLHNTLARLSYDEGVTPATIAATRTWAILLMFLAVLGGGRRQWPRVPRAAWIIFAITAVGYSLQNPLLLIAFRFIPVSLAVLILYVYPIVVALMAAAIGQERLRQSTMIAALAAFAGVGLVVEAGGSLDWRGAALAMIAAITLSANIVGAAQLNRHIGALSVPYALSCVGTIVFGALMFADGGPALPATAHGWWIFAAATLASPLALITFYLALPLAGAPRSSLMMNIEPVLTALLAVSILGERFGSLQIVGAVLIVGAIAVSAVMNLKFARS